MKLSEIRKVYMQRQAEIIIARRTTIGIRLTPFISYATGSLTIGIYSPDGYYDDCFIRGKITTSFLIKVTQLFEELNNEYISESNEDTYYTF